MDLIILPVVDSTNSHAQHLINQHLAHDGTAVVAWEQTNGRGQRGAAWDSQPGQGLYFSIILKPLFNSSGQVLLNKTLSGAVCDYIFVRTGFKPQIKWPNDILIDDRKVCGILLEASLKGENIQSIIFGAGINLNHSQFNTEFETPPVSFIMLTGKRYDPEEEAKLFYEFIWEAYQQFTTVDPDKINRKYSAFLYKKNEKSFFREGEKVFEAVLIDVDASGNALIEENGIVRNVQHPLVRMIV